MYDFWLDPGVVMIVILPPPGKFGPFSTHIPPFGLAKGPPPLLPFVTWAAVALGKTVAVEIGALLTLAVLVAVVAPCPVFK
jgi:hypothetical protein